jgi:hypothetical protein
VNGIRLGTAVLLAVAAGHADAAEPRLDVPLSVYAPAASSFLARVGAIHEWAKTAAGDAKDRRVAGRARDVVARRSSAPPWTRRKAPWSDAGEYTVHFAVGQVDDYQSSGAALNEAERRARAALADRAGGGKPYALDWYVNDSGVAWALVGALEPGNSSGSEAAPARDAESPPQPEGESEPAQP